MSKMKAYLVLEDGTVFDGEARGAFRETPCEIVFNTSMTGYFEVLTDPSYAGQGVVMTYPLIGNYGVNRSDAESARIQPSAFIVKELCDTPSNFRHEVSLEQMLIENDIPCLAGVDTRAIVKILRESGTMRGLLTDNADDIEACREKTAAFKHKDLVLSVTIKEPMIFGEGNKGPKIALYDFGAKRNIIKSLTDRGCVVRAYPASTPAKVVLDTHPDGIMLSNGPGDPKDCGTIIDEVGKIYESGVPTFAICLGHQLLALSQGADSRRLKYGHRGANHPVKFLDTDRTYITSQNHGYVIVPDNLKSSAVVSHINVNDGTVEGIRYTDKPVFSVQFHPEAAPGPQDTSFLFDDFLKMAGGKN